MLDLPRLEAIRLSARPKFQRVIASLLLAPNYEVFPRVRIAFEGADRIPDEPVVFAMNHTDRYNYWPFQYRLWRSTDRLTAAWVKGKYYEHPLLALFMEKVNSIPTVSRGYLITRDVLETLHRRPTDAEYDALRRWVEDEGSAPGPDVPSELATRPRDLFGRPFDPSRETYAAALRDVYRRMMRRFAELNAEAFAIGLDVLIFPQGTRSIRLSRGHIGISQVAIASARTIVPVGCSGSDRVYAGSAPLARGGRIVYRFGEPIRPPRLDVPFEPFDPADERRHRDVFQGLVDEVMDRVNDLVDPPYRYSEDRESSGVAGSRRFV